ncbi:MAG: diguanylate cyclase [Acidobacteriota bacterium]
MLEGQKLQISASIGISLYPSNARDIDELVRNADIAMYLAKKQGGNNYQLYLKP